MEEKQEIKKKKSNLKTKLLFLLFLMFLVVCCFVTLGFLWLAGYGKQALCNSVLEDSEIYNRIECTREQEKSGSNLYPFVTLKPNETNSNIEDGSVAQVVENTTAGVVGIGVTGEGTTQDRIIGTGFLISENGLLVTNRHVVSDEAQSYYVLFKDQKTPIQIDSSNIFRDPINDIALIRIDAKLIPAIAKVIAIGDSEKIQLGQTVIAIGNPLGTFTGTITKGIVSGLNREVTISKGFFSNQNEVFQDVIQTDAAINPGNSGGPLLNLKGEVIGVNFATIEGASNMSFALPINRIKSRVAELEQFNKFKIPFLGIQYQTKAQIINKESVVGALVTSVVKDSPADVAGIKAGDFIIKFNSDELNKKNFSYLIQTSQVGNKVTLTIVRNKTEIELNVTVGER